MARKFYIAFTLAEVLITLGIIGIVAAMTIPNLIAKVDRDSKIANVKKAHSVLNQAIKLSTIDNEDYETWDSSLSYQDYVMRYFAPYMNIAVFCDTYSKCNYKTSAPWIKMMVQADIQYLILMDVIHLLLMMVFYILY